ncbi:MAG TPA: BTAD domain-containing putative transcriptional regulator [Gemmatimonadaceae bacterium]|nr:BTAD domain-containing putative transcriptional regulator [Gemmatimonadaceae bacterium]
MPRFRLRTFGTLRLVGAADDTILGEHGHQRRRLALLAVLAASGERGRSRDQLLGLFWPDVPQSRARHSLEQLLYAIRTSLDESVFTGLNPVCLNPACIGSDIGDFANALSRGEREAAVEMYRGPFLEGFYLNDAPEFEQWMEAERDRIERSYTEALERLAKSAEDANDFAAAARWLLKLIDTDPVSSKHAIGLIRALMNAGDHAAALRYAERYEAIVGQELGTSVGPAVAALVAEVRARAKSESVVVRGAGPTTKRERDTDSATPSLLPPEAATNTAQPIAAPFRVRRRAMVLYGVAALVLAALALVGSRLLPRVAEGPASATAGASIAVLPLANVSGDPRDGPLADGLTEELIGGLAKIDRLRVVARTSAFVFNKSDLDPRQIADSLHVANILQGGVQKIGQRIRVQVRLVDGHDGSTRWAETYDRELKDIFLVQSEIATAVARELDLRLGGRTIAALRRAPTQNIAAYDLYLRGSDPALLRSDSGMQLSVDYFRKAIALDSTYAAAYAGLARMYLVSLLSQGVASSAREVYALAEEAALKAVALDDSLSDAHATVGLLLLLRYDFAAAEKELERARALDPGQYRTYRTLITLAYWKERPADALAEANRMVDLDPLSAGAHVELARAQCANGQYAQGLARLKSLEAIRPRLQRIPSYAATCHSMKGDWPAAVAALRPYQDNPADYRGRGWLGFALAHSGQRREALAVLADVTAHWQRSKQGAFEVAVVNAGLGNRDQAFEWLNRSVDDLSLSENIMLPMFGDLRGDPRFERLRSRLRF